MFFLLLLLCFAALIINCIEVGCASGVWGFSPPVQHVSHLKKTVYNAPLRGTLDSSERKHNVRAEKEMIR